MFLNYCFVFLKHGSLWVYRIATFAVLAAGIAFIALVIGLRYLVLPNINDYRETVAHAMTQAVGQRVTIGSIAGSWQGYRPELNLMDVKVFGQGEQLAFELDRVETVLSWLSLFSAEWRFDSLAVYGPSLEVRRDASGVFWIAGIAARAGGGSEGNFGDWLLAQRQVIVRDASITWLDEMREAPKLQLEKVDIRLDRDGSLHRFGLSAAPPAELASTLVAKGEFTGRSVIDVRAWTCKLYVEIAYADLARAQAWIPTPLKLATGAGSMRLWLEWNGNRLGAATADVKLANLRTRLKPELRELVLAEAHGRLGWKQEGERTEVSADSFGFTTAEGLKLAPTRVTYAQTAPVGGGSPHAEVHVAGFDLAPVAQLAEFLPFDDLVRARLAEIQPAGTVQEANVSWKGEWGAGGGFSANAQFAGLAGHPSGPLPGFQGLSGRFDATERGGAVSITVDHGGIELPRVFSAPIPLDFATVNAGWTMREKLFDISIKNASFANAHLAGSVSGSYHGEPDGRGSADLSGLLVRADAKEIWRYMPVTAPVTQAWLKRALLAGQSRDTRFRLKGPLKDFPFADGRSGVFEVITRVNDVTLDYVDGWVPVTGISGEAIFRGDHMDVRAQTGSILGLGLAGVDASIAELGKHDEVLHLKGAVRGATADFLKFISVTPVAGYINRFTEPMKAIGEAKLDLTLAIPLHRSKESTVKGELVLQNNGVVLDSRLPPFENFGARIGFTEHAFNVRDGRALMFGEPLSFEAANQADGGVTATVSGTLDVDQARTVWTHPVLGFLDGQTQWRGSVAVRNKVATIRFDSALTGIKSSLPPPFAKAAETSLPLRIEMRERPGRQGVLTVNLEKIASAQLLLDAAAPSGIGRGTISLGGQAALPGGDGLWIRGKADYVDVDAWEKVLPGGKDDSGPLLAGIDMQVDALDVGQRRFHNMKVDATLDKQGWQADLDGDEVAGDVSWVPEGDGKLVARLSRLVLPPAMTQIQSGKPASAADQRLPIVDLVADEFNYEGKELGRLTIAAQPESAGWRLQKLELVNPESRFSMNGRWVIAEASRTDVAVRLDVSDLGKFFARLGWPDSMQGGSATLEGPLAWSGNPTRLDIPSLSGELKLEARNGRFKQIEPGVAKLLGILSLQALPRRATLDFRDVFSKGFSFDRISSDLKIAGGVANTGNFLMKGSAAQVGMQGKVDLARETQDLIVKVTPSLSEGIAIAGAIVNPALGVAALLAQKALKDPFSQLASFDYSVTGSWSEPVIKRVPKSLVKEKGR
ncbi:MAG TPA: YhdP family protein [Burkholderiales bacterium]|nr:YhdP family protein [Burkholderiales bacterium]